MISKHVIDPDSYKQAEQLGKLAILLARIAVGLLFFLSGRSKLFVAERREQMHRTLIEAHVTFPDSNAFFVSTVEFVCGLLLIVGALMPLACALLAFVMIVAIATIAIRNTKAFSPAEWLAASLYLPEPLYLVILIRLFLSGPGWLSIDHLVLSRTRLEPAAYRQPPIPFKKCFLVGS